MTTQNSTPTPSVPYKVLLKTLNDISNYINEAEITQQSDQSSISTTIMIQKIREILKEGGIESMTNSKSKEDGKEENGNDKKLEPGSTTLTSNNKETDLNSEEENKQENNLPQENVTQDSPKLKQIKESPKKLFNPLRRRKISNSVEAEIKQEVDDKIDDEVDFTEENELEIENPDEWEPPNKKMASSSPINSSRTRRLQNSSRPKSAYTYFFELCKDAVKKQHPGVKVYIDLTALSRQCAERWKSMTEREKRSFRHLAKRDKERYEEEMRGLEAKKYKPRVPRVNGVSKQTPVATAKRNGSARSSTQDSATRNKCTVYTHEELQMILDYVCNNNKHGETGPLKMWIEAKKDGHFPGRTAVAVQQQFRKTIFPNLSKYVCTKQNRQLLRQAKMARGRSFGMPIVLGDGDQNEEPFEKEETLKDD